MGLDMYLSVEREVSADEELRRLLADLPDDYPGEKYLPMWRTTEGPEWDLVERVGLRPFVTSDSPSGYATNEIVGVTCVYWRKANAVHRWFVEKVQGGVDNCERYPVEAEALMHLAHLCRQAMDAYDQGDVDKAAALMHPTSGFFFGSCDIDEWWRSDMEHTAQSVERVVALALREPGRYRFAYRSSW